MAVTEFPLSYRSLPRLGLPHFTRRAPYHRHLVNNKLDKLDTYLFPSLWLVSLLCGDLLCSSCCHYHVFPTCPTRVQRLNNLVVSIGDHLPSTSDPARRHPTAYNYIPNRDVPHDGPVLLMKICK